MIRERILSHLTSTLANWGLNLIINRLEYRETIMWLLLTMGIYGTMNFLALYHRTLLFPIDNVLRNITEWSGSSNRQLFSAQLTMIKLILF